VAQRALSSTENQELTSDSCSVDDTALQVEVDDVTVDLPLTSPPSSDDVFVTSSSRNPTTTTSTTVAGAAAAVAVLTAGGTSVDAARSEPSTQQRHQPSYVEFKPQWKPCKPYTNGRFERSGNWFASSCYRLNPSWLFQSLKLDSLVLSAYSKPHARISTSTLLNGDLSDRH